MPARRRLGASGLTVSKRRRTRRERRAHDAASIGVRSVTLLADAVAVRTAPADRDQPGRRRRTAGPARAGDSRRRSNGATRWCSAIPTSLTELTRALADEVEAGTPLVAVGGGDGTLHHAVNAIARRADHAGAAAARHAATTSAAAWAWRPDCRSRACRPSRRRDARQVDVLDVNGVRVLTVAGLGVVSSARLQVGRLARPGTVAPAARAGLRLAGLSRGCRRAAAVRAATGAPRDGALARPRPTAAWQQVDGRYYGIFLACRPDAGRRASSCRSTWRPTTGGSRSCWWSEARGCPWRCTCRGCAAARAGAARHPVDSPGGRGGRSSGRDGTAIVGDGEDLGVGDDHRGPPAAAGARG